MRLPEEPKLLFQINIIPLLDVLFALLTFFIMSSLYLTRSEGLPVNLPKAATAESQTQSIRVTVTIDKQGNLALNRQPIGLDALEGQVQKLAGDKEQVMVVLNADARVSHGQVVAVIERVRRVKGVKVAIATTEPLIVRLVNKQNPADQVIKQVDARVVEIAQIESLLMLKLRDDGNDHLPVRR